MTRFNISYKYSNNGTAWSMTSTFVNASSSAEAIKMVKKKHPYVKEVRVIAKKPV